MWGGRVNRTAYWWRGRYTTSMVLEAVARPVIAPCLYVDPAAPLTTEEWWTLPDDGRQYELLDGVLFVVPPPTLLHQKLTLRLASRLDQLTLQHGGFAGIAPLGTALSASIGFEPDIVYVVPGREAILSDRGVEGVPDLVVEVLSPSTRAFDLAHKLPIYLAVGVSEVWIVDPVARTVTVHRAAGAASVAFGERIPSSVVNIGDGGLT